LAIRNALQAVARHGARRWLIGVAAALTLGTTLLQAQAASAATAHAAHPRNPAALPSDLNPHTASADALPGNNSPSSSFPGYRIVSTAGLVGAYGEPYHASLSGTALESAVRGAAGTPDGEGYWLVAGDGGVFAYGDAVFHGSLSGRSLERNVVGITATPDGGGYWEVGADGGVFAFGDAGFYGSLAGAPLHAAIVGIAATPDGRGYWLAGADGGVFAFGDASFYGSANGANLNRHVVGLAASPDGDGYWLVSSDGGVFAYGDAHFFGSAALAQLTSPVVGMAATPDGAGYWLVAGDGGIFAFGDAPFRGSAVGSVPNGQWVGGITAGPGTRAGEVSGDFTKPASPPRWYASGATGFDVSWPQCAAALPPPSTIAVVGINDGTANTFNPCFRTEASWAGLELSVYINVNSPNPAIPSQWAQGPAGACAPTDARCSSYNYGFNSTRGAIDMVRSEGFKPHTWWLDVETLNAWSPDPGANAQAVAGALDAIARSGGRAAIYSTTLQWNEIAGGYRPGVPAWYATGEPLTTPEQLCSGTSFSGGPVELVQGLAGSFDSDYAC
jgi:hypothetical protein